MPLATTTRRTNGTSVRIIREALGIKGCDLAARAHISGPFLTRIEQGARQPSPKVMVDLASGLGVPLEAITYPVAS